MTRNDYDAALRSAGITLAEVEMAKVWPAAERLQQQAQSLRQAVGDASK